MPHTILLRKVACLAVLLLWGASSTAQAQDTTHVQVSKRAPAKGTKNIRYRTKLGASVFLYVPFFTLEPQLVIRDRVGIGLRFTSLALANHLALQLDVFFPLRNDRRLSVGGHIGAGHAFIFPIVTMGARLAIEGKSRFSFGLGYEHAEFFDIFYGDSSESWAPMPNFCGAWARTNELKGSEAS